MVTSLVLLFMTVAYGAALPEQAVITAPVDMQRSEEPKLRREELAVSPQGVLARHSAEGGMRPSRKSGAEPAALIAGQSSPAALSDSNSTGNATNNATIKEKDAGTGIALCWFAAFLFLVVPFLLMYFAKCIASVHGRRSGADYFVNISKDHKGGEDLGIEFSGYPPDKMRVKKLNPDIAPKEVSVGDVLVTIDDKPVQKQAGDTVKEYLKRRPVKMGFIKVLDASGQADADAAAKAKAAADAAAKAKAEADAAAKAKAEADAAAAAAAAAAGAKPKAPVKAEGESFHRSETAAVLGELKVSDKLEGGKAKTYTISLKKPAVITGVIVISDWWKKRPNSVKVVDDAGETLAEKTVGLDLTICGVNGNEECNGEEGFEHSLIRLAVAEGPAMKKHCKVVVSGLLDDKDDLNNYAMVEGIRILGQYE